MRHDDSFITQKLLSIECISNYLEQQSNDKDGKIETKTKTERNT